MPIENSEMSHSVVDSPKLNMETVIWILAFLTPCLGEWVLLPPIFPKQVSCNKEAQNCEEGLNYVHDFKQSQKETPFLWGNASSNDICPDFHNLTAMSYGSSLKEKNESDWGISLEDVNQLIKQHQQLPKSINKKVEFVKKLSDNIMAEAERRIRSLFSPVREARTTHIHSPSMESALMTISILLFGVFLSKLILKLLASHYNRYNGTVMTMVGGIRAPVNYAHGRRVRSLQSELQKIQLMHLIDKYNSRFN